VLALKNRGVQRSSYQGVAAAPTAPYRARASARDTHLVNSDRLHHADLRWQLQRFSHECWSLARFLRNEEHDPSVVELIRAVNESIVRPALVSYC
ncbi:MAG: hypothetical protein ABI967_13960, partial [bacterium]